MTKRKIDIMHFETSRNAAIGQGGSGNSRGTNKVNVINLDRSNTDLAVGRLETSFTRKKVEEMLREGQLGSTELPPGHI
ncbi:hypothetical protein [Burkholderia pseudomallei]|uniref:hypothetical protein n=1 Tax=Burkholderia pseudomallei TaxID=28450 RepID=UPI002AB383B1|nr:hypothetical protein [Burkholderia pseudomallei]MDY7779529.1 hypothetical protein [Burkholderia pseudomallei]MDY7812358.1 hypothetical protein [Burkholderia pseudomallei]